MQCGEVDIEGSCLRLTDSKEGASVRPIGLPVLEYLEARRDEEQSAEDYVFPGWEDDTPFGAFPRQWTKLFKDTDLAGITPHVLRHSFASIGNDLGFTEATIAALVGHSRGTVTSRYIHTVDTALIMAADSIAGYIQGLLDGVAFTHTAYALDRDSRKSALATLFGTADTRRNEWVGSDPQRDRTSRFAPQFSRCAREATGSDRGAASSPPFPRPRCALWA